MTRTSAASVVFLGKFLQPPCPILWRKNVPVQISNIRVLYTVIMLDTLSPVRFSSNSAFCRHACSKAKQPRKWFSSLKKRIQQMISVGVYFGNKRRDALSQWWKKPILNWLNGRIRQIRTVRVLFCIKNEHTPMIDTFPNCSEKRWIWSYRKENFARRTLFVS